VPALVSGQRDLRERLGFRRAPRPPLMRGGCGNSTRPAGAQYAFDRCSSRVSATAEGTPLSALRAKHAAFGQVRFQARFVALGRRGRRVVRCFGREFAVELQNSGAMGEVLAHGSARSQIGAKVSTATHCAPSPRSRAIEPSIFQYSNKTSRAARYAAMA